MLPNHHITKPVFIGEIKRRRPVRRRVEDARAWSPGDAWSQDLPGFQGPVGDWVEVSAATTTPRPRSAAAVPDSATHLIDDHTRKAAGNTAAFHTTAEFVPGLTAMRLHYDRIIAFAFVLGLLLVGAGLPLMPGPFEDAVGKFATDEFDDTDQTPSTRSRQRQSAGLRHRSARCRTGRLMSDRRRPRRSTSQPKTARSSTPRPAQPSTQHSRR